MLTRTHFIGRPPLAALTLTASTPDGSAADLAWIDQGATEASYTVERSGDDGLTWTVRAVLAADATSYTDDPGPGDWEYRVQASNPYGSTYSNTAHLYVGGVGVANPPLVSFVVTATGGGTAHADWSFSSTPVDSVTIEWSDDGGATYPYALGENYPLTSADLGLIGDGVTPLRFRAQTISDSIGSAYSFFGPIVI